SAAAVELRNRLAAISQLRLPTTLVFDRPTPVAVARYLRAEITRAQDGAPAAAPLGAGGAPLAVGGMSWRYPGGGSSPPELWQLVPSGADAIDESPADRGWELGRLYDSDPDSSGTSYTHRGGFLYDAPEFDAQHFSISPREALAMDPQQRLLLEGAWEAFEDAGIGPLGLRGSQTGVFAGVASADYAQGMRSPQELEGLRLTGGAMSVISGRIAYPLGLQGPAVSVDTACSA